jgi:exopolyphosphatase/guanosine-5'-triphosphate,3'-diphosphate pyrophosphatase
MRVATIDIGTNTVLLLIAERRADGALVALDERATITRLGEGVDVNRRLSAAAIARTEACLDAYAEVVGNLRAERIAVVGTSAMRDAAGGEELARHIQSAFGVAVRIVSGSEEARLTFRGALGGLDAAEHAELAVFDIGGGSTEVVFGRLGAGRPTVEYGASFDIGSVRLTERHVSHDPLTADEFGALSRAAREAFAAVPPLRSPHPPFGIAGTMTTLAAIELGLSPYDGARVHGHTMKRDELRRVVDRLARVDLDSRRRIAGMEPKRADVIVAGGCIALALLDHWNVNDVVISDRGVRWGLAAELAEEHGDPSIRNVFDSLPHTRGSR